MAHYPRFGKLRQEDHCQWEDNLCYTKFKLAFRVILRLFSKDNKIKIKKENRNVKEKRKILNYIRMSEKGKRQYTCVDFTRVCDHG